MTSCVSCQCNLSLINFTYLLRNHGHIFDSRDWMIEITLILLVDEVQIYLCNRQLVTPKCRQTDWCWPFCDSWATMMSVPLIGGENLQMWAFLPWESTQSRNYDDMLLRELTLHDRDTQCVILPLTYRFQHWLEFWLTLGLWMRFQLNALLLLLGYCSWFKVGIEFSKIFLKITDDVTS